MRDLHYFEHSPSLDATIQSQQTSPLLPKTDPETSQNEPPSSSSSSSSKLPEGYLALPTSFLASFAIAVTAASTVYAYAHIVCEDATHCSDSEKAAYTSAVALATTLANLFSLTAMGIYERLPTRGALTLWMILRGGSVVVLTAGVFRRSIPLALAARVLEGLATDNVLHLTLNALYARSKDQHNVGRLMSVSLALYMGGMALSPALAALLTDFRISFGIAIGIFALTIIYLAIVGPLENGKRKEPASSEDGSPPAPTRRLKELTKPIVNLVSDRTLLMYGTSMLLYNAAVSYMFPALMIHATLQFGFSSATNGLLISVAAGSSSMYLLLSAAISTPARNAPSAVASLLVLMAAMCGLAAVPVGWALFPGVAVAAFGLATPSFIKAHMIQRRPRHSAAVAAIAVAEGLGSLLAAPILGGWQVVYPGGSVLFVSAGLIAASTVSFLAVCAIE
ncbi:uncharacterized protein RCC_09404 [Ramularia collo-cygni]|uniref:Major facilitator superfamily (MFS) profile domain-containing protein n=1 Tax=Ramularia collo-cygni TaxID=112498 RepID=A0A2D3V9U2_9PEZI|nr:uncharacterized protein RCC_09404 [Ramularia collo-cygni]CZT23690.1 uncharacterized protein RCC_09404 [Ramularia collo-cygni]